MGKIYCKIDMEKVEKIINQKGFYFISTKVLYPDFVGPEYIIVSDDPDITVKYPKTKGMIIVSVEKFASMAKAYNCYYKNDVKHLRRVERTHNSEGYFEDVMGNENGDKLLQIMDIDMEPVESVVDQHIENEEVIKAMDCLTDTQKERIKKYYFQQMTYDEIAKLEKVGKMTVYRSIRGGINKMKKKFF
mgnify:CR=1 FL=1